MILWMMSVPGEVCLHIPFYERWDPKLSVVAFRMTAGAVYWPTGVLVDFAVQEENQFCILSFSSETNDDNDLKKKKKRAIWYRNNDNGILIYM